MKSYYPGTLPKITGDPKEMFRVLDGKVCDFERSKELQMLSCMNHLTGRVSL